MCVVGICGRTSHAARPNYKPAIQQLHMPHRFATSNDKSTGVDQYESYSGIVEVCDNHMNRICFTHYVDAAFDVCAGACMKALNHISSYPITLAHPASTFVLLTCSETPQNTPKYVWAAAIIHQKSKTSNLSALTSRLGGMREAP